MKLTSFVVQLLEQKLGFEVKYMREFTDLWRQLEDIEKEASDRYGLLIECYMETVAKIYNQFIKA